MPNAGGVKLVITVGTAQPVELGVGQTGEYTVCRNQVIQIKPKNNMMQPANYTD
jgi:hypothetical protein